MGNSLWIYYFSADSLWTYYFFLDLSMKTLDLSWINFEFTIIFANKLCIHSVLHEKTLNSLSLFANQHSIQYLFSIWSKIHYEFSNLFSNSLLIYYILRKFTMNSFYRELTISLRVHFPFTIFFANSLWIPSLLREFTNNSLWIKFAMK